MSDRWKRFELRELEELKAAVESRLQIAKEYATDEWACYDLQRLAEELHAAYEERKKIEKAAFAGIPLGEDDELPF